jgi:hypothetical protein
MRLLKTAAMVTLAVLASSAAWANPCQQGAPVTIPPPPDNVPEPEKVKWVDLSFRDAANLAVRTGRPILLHFYNGPTQAEIRAQPDPRFHRWCPFALSAEKLVLHTPAVMEALDKHKFIAVRINMREDDGKKLQRMFGVKLSPTQVLFQARATGSQPETTRTQTDSYRTAHTREGEYVEWHKGYPIYKGPDLYLKRIKGFFERLETVKKAGAATPVATSGGN